MTDSVVITPLRTPLPDRWDLLPLGPLCTKIGSGATPKGGSAVYVASGVSFIRSQNVLDHEFSQKGLAFIDNEAAERLTYVTVKPRDVLLNITGDGDTIARCCVVPPNILPARTNQHVVIIRTKPILVPEYLQKYLSHPLIRDYMLSHNSGGSRRAITKGQIEGFQIMVPPLSEQHAIASILGALDDKIAVNDRIAKSARELSRAHFRAAAAGYDAQKVELASIIELLSRGVAPHYTEDQSQFIVLNQKCIRDGRVSFAPSRKTITQRVPEVKILRPHDVLVNSTGVGTLGRVARWTKTNPCTVDSHVTIVRFNSAKIDPVCAGFGMLEAQMDIEALGEGSTGQTELSRGQLAALHLVLPSRDQTVHLRPKLDALEERSNAALEESLSLAKLRDTLLPKLMSGEIRVRDAEKVVEDAT